mmetsp:Transcript_27517/g.43350  ORF Transcript_27517/g.43350 Transcript_27517/m.43350 type:complete len:247 (+) Transcript_27517:40-780(+)
MVSNSLLCLLVASFLVLSCEVTAFCNHHIQNQASIWKGIAYSKVKIKMGRYSDEDLSKYPKDVQEALKRLDSPFAFDKDLFVKNPLNKKQPTMSEQKEKEGNAEVEKEQEVKEDDRACNYEDDNDDDEDVSLESILKIIQDSGPSGSEIDGDQVTLASAAEAVAGRQTREQSGLEALAGGAEQVAELDPTIKALLEVLVGPPAGPKTEKGMTPADELKIMSALKNQLSDEDFKSIFDNSEIIGDIF